MITETKPAHITPADGNALDDPGFEPQEAAALKAEPQRLTSENLPSRRPS